MATKVTKQSQSISREKKYQPPKEIKQEHGVILLEIGMTLRILRKKKKMSSYKLAENVGISRNTYNLMERGRIYFNISTLLQVLTYYYGDNISDFFKVSEFKYFVKEK